MKKFALRAAGESWFGTERELDVIKVKTKMKKIINVVLAAEMGVVLILMIAILLAGSSEDSKKTGGESVIIIEESDTVEDWGEIDWN